MTALRRLVFDHRLFAAWIVALALAMKLVVPAGYMIGGAAGSFAIEICSGSAPEMTTRTMTMTMPGMDHRRETPQHQGKDMPCAFSGLAAPGLAAADPLLLARAVRFIIATMFRTAMPSVAQVSPFLRPPLRGPPLAG